MFRSNLYIKPGLTLQGLAGPVVPGHMVVDRFMASVLET
jgi:hypothetical protein